MKYLKLIILLLILQACNSQSAKEVEENKVFDKTITSLYHPDVDIETFTPSDLSNLQVGTEVLHKIFGKGEVVKLDSLTATVKFQDLKTRAEKNISIKFGELQIVK